MSRVVLVTGVSHDLGRRVAQQLAGAIGVNRVIGVDVSVPRGDMGTVQFLRADIRNPVIAKVIAREKVDTVVHMSVLARAGGRASAKELNVIGTMQLLAACQRAPGLGHLVVKSSTAVYGSSNRDPAMFREDMAARRLPSWGFGKDVSEVESYVRGFARRRPDVRVTTLRAGPVLGPDVNTAMASYFRLPAIPTVLGFDPRLQFLDHQDLLDAIQYATLNDIPGTFNIAGEGLMMLSQVIRRLGRPAVPMPGFALAQLGAAFSRLRLADLTPEQVGYLTYGRGVDTNRMHEMLGFHPARSTEQAFAAFADSLRPGPISQARVRAAERVIADAIGGSRHE